MANAMIGARHDCGTYRRVEVITGVQRRQNWTSDEKARIVAESLEPEANVSEVARRNGVSRGLLNVWRRQARELAMAPEAMFAAVRIESDDGLRPEAGVSTGKPMSPPIGAIEVDIGGATMRVPVGADRATLDTVIAALRGMR